MKQVKMMSNRIFAAMLAVLMVVGSMVATPAQTAQAAATTIDQVDWSKAFGIYDAKKKVLDPAAAIATLEKTTTKKGKSPVTKTYSYTPGKKINVTALTSKTMTVTEKVTYVIPFANRPDITFDGDNIAEDDVVATEPIIQALNYPQQMTKGKSSSFKFYGGAYVSDTYWKTFETSWTLYAKKDVSMTYEVSILAPDESKIFPKISELSKEGGYALDDLEWGSGYVVTVVCNITPQKK